MEAAGNAPPPAAKKAGPEEEEGKRGRCTARGGTPREGDGGSGGQEVQTGEPES